MQNKNAKRAGGKPPFLTCELLALNSKAIAADSQMGKGDLPPLFRELLLRGSAFGNAFTQFIHRRWRAVDTDHPVNCKLA